MMLNKMNLTAKQIKKLSSASNLWLRHGRSLKQSKDKQMKSSAQRKLSTKNTNKCLLK